MSISWKAEWQQDLPTDCLHYVDEYVVLYNADCRHIFPRLPRKKYVGFTDPPYNIGKDYGTWKDDLPEEEYLRLCMSFTQWMKIHCKINTIVTPNKWLLDYWTMLGKSYKQVVLTWDAANALRANWLACYSMMLTNAKPLKNGTPDWWPNMQKAGLGFLCKEDDYGHPGYTSEAITNRVLTDLCPPEGIILDPFGGTGTSAWCCKLRTRPCVITEVDKGWCDVIVRRCSQHVMPLGC